ncbi:MAG: AAA family ATPase [Sulfuricaulis sp.]|nr:AAA family ATPase [Sulfuricaulis sp.]
MKILRLQSSNVMRLVAVDITPTGDMVIVGGKNGAGKSSVLNSIAMALGGQAMCPAEPIRAGETEAKIVVDLGDLIVTRKFYRHPIHAPECERTTHPQSAHPCSCMPTFGETQSTLTVTNKDGARYPSPQAVLDRLLGALTFDPLAFARDDAKRQAETLRALVRLDTADIEDRRKAAFAERAMLKKSHAIKAAQLKAMPFVKDAPDAEVPVDAITAEMARAEELRKAAEDAERTAQKQRDQANSLATARRVMATRIEELEKQLTGLRSEAQGLDEKFDAVAREITTTQATADAARAAVPDAEALRAKVKDTETMNAAVRANKTYLAAQADAERIAAEIEAKHQAVLAAEEAKRAALAAVVFPVEGLGLSDDGVTFGSLPFAQASSSEQLRVSVAIGLALNPTLKVLLVRSGNLLDDDSLKAVAAQADAAECQIWMEYVTADAEGVSVMIEEGKVVTE